MIGRWTCPQCLGRGDDCCQCHGRGTLPTEGRLIAAVAYVWRRDDCAACRAIPWRGDSPIRKVERIWR